MDSAAIVAVLTLGGGAFSFILCWLLKIERNMYDAKNSREKIDRMESELDDIDKRVRNTELAITRIETMMTNIDRKVEALLTLAERRRRDD